MFKSMTKDKLGLSEFTGMNDNSPINIIYCDTDFTITYVNPKSIETLRKLQAHLPIPVDQIVGSSIDVFHKNPSHQRNLLSNPRNLPHRTIIEVGPEKLDLLVSAIFDDRSEYIGSLVTWDIVTKKIVQENDLARVNSMIEGAPANMMCGDIDGVITYMNPASMRTLKTLEEHLPCSVDEIIGRSFDQFHQTPSIQKKIIASPENLPHRAIINVGPEQLDLLVSPTFNKQGQYSGPMVSWEVVTEKLKAEAEIAKIQSMMAAAPVNIMWCDTSGTIQYLNPASKKTLLSLEKHLPCKVSEIVGGSFDRFHKDPDHQRKIISDQDNLPHSAIIEVGPEKLNFLASATFDNDGNYIGPMVTWEVVTDQLKLEQDMASTKAMVDNAPINIMLADRDLNLVYVNPGSTRQLKEIEQYLPCKTDNLIGESIDIFHKDPSVQRKILMDDKNLPYNVLIDVGPEKFNLLAAAVYNTQGEYIGPMVTWSKVTTQNKMVEDLSQASSQLASAAEELNATANEMSVNAESAKRESSQAATSTEEVSAGVAQVAASTEEMAASIKEISGNMSETSNMVSKTMEEAETSNTIMNQLATSSQEIGDVIKVINSIAQQTNLLALNATIEAARAGEAGRGFAVVANEVKELANQTGAATEEITKKINAIQSDTHQSVSALKSISDSISRVNDISTQISASIEEQNATTNELSRIAGESSQGVEGVAINVRNVSEASDCTAEGSRQLVEAAGSLKTLASQLDNIVNLLKSDLDVKN